MPPSTRSLVKDKEKAASVPPVEVPKEQTAAEEFETVKAVVVEPVELSAEDQVAYKGWIPMTNDEHLVAQEQGVLAGWDPIKGLGLILSQGEK